MNVSARHPSAGGLASLFQRGIVSRGRRFRMAPVLTAMRSLLVLAVIWQLLAFWAGNALLLPGPWRTALAFRDLVASGELFEHAAISFGRLLISLAIAIALAVPLGFLMGLSRNAAELLDPVVELLRPISGIAWIPLGLFIFGIGGTLPVFIMVYAASFPLLFNTIAGVRAVDQRFLDAARTMGVPHSAVLLRIIVPAALPGLIVGLRLAVASAWTAIVAAELIGAASGVGFAIEWYRELLMTSKVLVFIALIGAIGYATDLALRALLHRLAPWASATALS